MNQLEGEIQELERRKAEITEEVKSLDEEYVNPEWLKQEETLFDF